MITYILTEELNSDRCEPIRHKSYQTYKKCSFSCTHIKQIVLYCRNTKYDYVRCPFSGWTGWQVDKGMGHWVEDNTLTATCYKVHQSILTINEILCESISSMILTYSQGQLGRKLQGGKTCELKNMSPP